MFSTCSGVRLKARPFLSVGTMLARFLMPTPWIEILVAVGRVAEVGDLVRRLEEPALVEQRPHRAGVVGLDGEDAGGRFEIALVGDAAAPRPCGR